MTEIRKLETSDIGRIGEVDRSEVVHQIYVWRDGCLQLEDDFVSIPPWEQDSEGAHSLARMIADWAPYLENDGTMFGAFDGETLAGFAIYRPRLTPDTGQLAVLHVSHNFRRRGIGEALSIKCMEQARSDGAQRMYVSATPTKGTVEFYRALGFVPTTDPNQALYELEPDDIHMIMDLVQPRR